MPGQAKPVRSTRSLDLCPAMMGTPVQINFLSNWDFVRAKKGVEHFAHKIREMDEMYANVTKIMLYVFYWKCLIHLRIWKKKKFSLFWWCCKFSIIVYDFDSLAIKNHDTKTTSCILSNGLTQHVRMWRTPEWTRLLWGGSWLCDHLSHFKSEYTRLFLFHLPLLQPLPVTLQSNACLCVQHQSRKLLTRFTSHWQVCCWEPKKSTKACHDYGE